MGIVALPQVQEKIEYHSDIALIKFVIIWLDSPIALSVDGQQLHMETNEGSKGYQINIETWTHIPTNRNFEYKIKSLDVITWANPKQFCG